MYIMYVFVYQAELKVEPYLIGKHNFRDLWLKFWHIVDPQDMGRTGVGRQAIEGGAGVEKNIPFCVELLLISHPLSLSDR